MNQQLTMKDNEQVQLSVTPNGGLPLPGALTWTSTNNTMVDLVPVSGQPLAVTVKAKGIVGTVTVYAKCLGLPDLAVDISIITSVVYATSWVLVVGAPYHP